MWVVVVSDSDGFPAEALGPFDDVEAAARVAHQAREGIRARDSRFSGTEGAYLLELERWSGRQAWQRRAAVQRTERAE